MAEVIYVGDVGIFKTCTKCGEAKPLDGFHKQSECAFGVRPSCKVCDSERNAAWRVQNKEKCASYKKIIVN